jgi:putative ABC transport system permease protein
LIDKEEAYQATFSGVGPIFGVGVFIGFAVGMMIAYQILLNDIFDQLPQYATLKAMGYGNRYLVKVVLQQAMIYGIVGYVPAMLMCSILFKIVGDIVLLPMHMTPRIIAISLSLTLGMCIISALIAVRRVIQADPAELFR